jgi:Zn-dependent peptidase ImmA (M78 family)
MRISDLNGDEAAEARANTFASDLLIPPSDYAEFLATTGRPAKAEVAAFAERLGIAPSIVVGRLQMEQHIPFNWMNDAKTKLRWGTSDSTRGTC